MGVFIVSDIYGHLLLYISAIANSTENSFNFFNIIFRLSLTAFIYLTFKFPVKYACMIACAVDSE